MKNSLFRLLLAGMLTISGHCSLLWAQVETNHSALLQFSASRAAEMQERKAQALEYAAQRDIPVIMEADGQYRELMYLDEFGQPQYYSTQNAISSATISTNKLYPSANLGLSIDGAGITVHEWDGGAVRTTHQELAGRVIMGDGATTTHPHSTHVAGTLIASGVVPTAKGMAPAASLRAFDWNSDEAEMASEAANQNALVSNHSYGYVRGWYYNGSTWVWYGNTSISTLEDYLFGFYDSQARNWDLIAYNAPYYLITKSAGNDRGEGPAGGTYPLDGPYDCIGNAGVAKNILTVGAVYDIPNGYTQPSDVIMSSFSGWGPADDSRIKPDVVANGISLYSSLNGSDSQYGYYSGTSMASPSAAGSMILLQKHHHTLTGQYMRASTLKALVIHTADEAGTTPGPDYQFGWGLMNTYKAAQKITEDQNNNVIEELVLANGGTYQRTVTTDGTQPLVVTIVWTDPAGNPVSASLDPINPMLINDLDLHISSGGTNYYPWKLSAANPSAAATNTAENNVDNVEHVFIANPAAGTYTITVDHDGTLLNGQQAFSIIISGITVSAPPLVLPVANFTGTPTTLNAGGSVTFTDLSSGNPTSWTWSFPGGTPATSTATAPVVAYSLAGTYDVTLIVTNADGSDTLTRPAYILVNALPPPPVSPIADFTGSPTSLLVGGSVNFTDLSLNGPTSWNWSFPGGSPSSSISQNPVVTYANAGTYTVALSVTNAAGTDTKTVTDYISVSAPVPVYCATHGNASAEWINSSTIGGITTTSGSSGVSGYQDFTATIIQAEAGASMGLSLSPGFSSTSRNEYWRVWIDYNGDQDFSDPGELVFSSNKKKTAVSGSVSIPAGLNLTTRLRVSMKRSSAASACEIFSQGEVEDYTIAIAPPMPVAGFSATATTIIEGSSVSFTDLSSGSPTSWLWTFSGGNPSSSTAQNPTVVYQTPGTYDVILTASNAVGSDTETRIGYITVTTPPPPSAYCEPTGINNVYFINSVKIGSTTSSTGKGTSGYAHYSSPSFSLSPGQTVAVTLSPSNTYSRFYWKIWIDVNGDGDFLDANETLLTQNNKKGSFSANITIPSSASGNARLRVAMRYGGAPAPCLNSFIGEMEDYDITLFASNALTMKEMDKDLEIRIYPNPVQELLNLDITSPETEVIIRLTDARGQLIDHFLVAPGTTTLNTSGYPSGLYFLQVTDKQKTVSRVLIKQ